MTTYQAADIGSPSHGFPISNEQASEGMKPYVPFCGRRFKVLRVAAHTLTSLIVALACKILSIACWITFQRGKARMYSDWASYKFEIGLSRPFSYALYRSKIINFAYNSTGIYRKPVDESLSKKELLKGFYGETFEEMQNRYHSEKVPIDESKLDFYPIHKGICFGESVDFISRYLSSGQTVEEISQYFEKGGTAEAQITQIISSSQDLEQIIKLKREFCEEYTNENERVQEELKRIEELVNSLTSVEAKNRIKEEADRILDLNERREFVAAKIAESRKERLELLDRSKQLSSDFVQKDIKFEAGIVSDRVIPLGRMNGLDLNLEKIILDENYSRNDDPAGLLEFIKSLPNGAYLTLLKNGDIDRSDHAIGLIKDPNGQHVIFDPNFAALKMDDDTDLTRTLWDISKTFYNTHGECKMYFYSCQESA